MLRKGERLAIPQVAQRNKLYCGDCLNELDRIENESVGLIYIDPPFYSQKYYEVIWGENAERFGFEDRMRGGRETYISYLLDRIRRLHDKLKKTGSFYIHLDWHIGHYMKVELDKLFGYHNFQNEIVWHYRRWTAPGKRFQRLHDVLFFYTKGKDYTFNQLMTPYTSGSVERKEQGILHRFKKGEKPVLVSRGTVPKGGVPENDVWHIPFVAPSAKERLGYPTQKPLALLERIVSASSNPGDVVLDAFCGCGTTMEAAQRLGRRWIGIDVSQTAIRVVQNRLRKIGAPAPEVVGLVENEEQLRRLDPFEFQNWAINAVQGRHSPKKIADMGIDGFTFFENHPIQVKRMDAVGRPEVDKLVGVLGREKDKKGMLVAFGFTRGTIGEVARLKRESGIEIQLLTCAELLKGLHAKQITL